MVETGRLFFPDLESKEERTGGRVGTGVGVGPGAGPRESMSPGSVALAGPREGSSRRGTKSRWVMLPAWCALQCTLVV